MRRKPLALLVTTAVLLAACARYTEQTSPCFGRDGQPDVTRAGASLVGVSLTSISFTGMSDEQKGAPKDCVFEALPRAV